MAAGLYGTLGGTAAALGSSMVRQYYTTSSTTNTVTYGSQQINDPYIWQFHYSSWPDAGTGDTYHQLSAYGKPQYGGTYTTGNYMAIYTDYEQQRLSARWIEAAETARNAANAEAYLRRQMAAADKAWREMARQQSWLDPDNENNDINVLYGRAAIREEGQPIRIEPGSVRPVRSADIEIIHPDKDTAEKTAQEMLREMIGEKEIAVYNDTGRLLVRGKKADYIVQKHGLVQRIPRGKAEVIDLCVHLRERSKYPVTDNVIALKMLIENDERSFLKTANHHLPRKLIEMPRAACAG